MGQYLPTAPYRGTRDFLPADMSVREQVFHRLFTVVESYGFARYDGPILESAEIYEAKSGREIADLQLYTLTDRGGRRLAVRPEMTPSVARMIAGNMSHIQFPARWYCLVNCHRYERPQRGRVREHWQINADVFGSGSPRCEIELFELIHDMMGAIGATSDMYVLRASDRVILYGILDEVVGLSEAEISRVVPIIDRWEKYPRDQIASDAREAGLSDRQFDALEVALKAGPDIVPELSSSVLERSQLGRILQSEAAGLVTFDPTVVRAFEYYTSTVFEVFDRDPENSRSLLGGGRYSDLVGLFSPRSLPGVGFAMGDVTLFDFLGTHGLLPEPSAAADVAVAGVSDGLDHAVSEVARRLRQAGLRVVVPLESRKLGKQIAEADRAGIQVVVIVGPADWSEGNVIVRHLPSSTQEAAPVAEMAERIRALGTS